MPTEGQIARGPNGERAVFTGGRWIMGGGNTMPGPNPIKVAEAQANIGQSQASAINARTNAAKTAAEIQNVPLQGAKITRELRQTPISEDDAKRIDAMRQQLGEMPETLNVLNQTVPAVDRFNPGPQKAARLNSSVPAPDAGIIGGLKAGIGQLLTGTSDQDIADFKAIQRAQNMAVLDKQIAQKGPQTESDALRMAMTAISPDKPKALNARIIGDAILSGILKTQRIDFYTQWANRNGSLGALENGKSVDRAWNERVQTAQRRFTSDPRIRRLGTPQGGGNSNIISVEKVSD